MARFVFLLLLLFGDRSERSAADDLDLAKDFFSYFAATRSLLDADPTIMVLLTKNSFHLLIFLVRIGLERQRRKRGGRRVTKRFALALRFFSGSR